MSTPKHTPGPWLVGSVYNSVNKVIPKVFGKNDSFFCLVDGHDDSLNQANAALIASAPDLLNEVEQILEAFEQKVIKADSKTLNSLIIHNLRDLIKKARGES